MSPDVCMYICTFIEQETKTKLVTGKITKADLCFSLQETLFAMCNSWWYLMY